MKKSYSKSLHFFRTGQYLIGFKRWFLYAHYRVKMEDLEGFGLGRDQEFVMCSGLDRPEEER